MELLLAMAGLADDAPPAQDPTYLDPFVLVGRSLNQIAQPGSSKGRAKGGIEIQVGAVKSITQFDDSGG